MRLKSVVKYNLFEMKNSLLIFYSIIVAVLVLICFSFLEWSVNASSGGTDMASVIFLFVVGLNSFKVNYLFLSTNGISRRTQFCGFMVAILPLTAVMALIDTLVANILPLIINYDSMFSQLYTGVKLSSGNLILFVQNFIWSMALYLFAITLGYFITILYYRMSKLLKTIVSIGVPALFLIIFPAMDTQFNSGRLLYRTIDLLTFLIGLKNGYIPLIATISFIIMAAVLAGLTYLLVRKAPVKE